MVDVIQRLILESEVGNTQRELEQVRKEQTKLERAIRDGAKATDKSSSEYKEQVQALKGLVDRERDLEEQIRRTNDAYGSRRQVIQKTDSFDRVSQDVSLAGDAESNLRTVGGAIGAFGGTGIERGIGQASELFAVVEAAPRLKAAFAGMPQTISAAASALGPAGLLVGAIAAGALAIEALWKRSIKNVERELKALADASADFVDFAAGGGTSNEAADLNEESRRRIELTNKEIANLQEEYEDRNFNFWDTLRNDGEQALVDQIKDFEDSIVAEEELIKRRAAAIEGGELATNDAAAAEERLAAERDKTGDTDKQVDAEKKLAAARDETAKATTRAAVAAREVSSQSAGFARRRADSARNRSAATIGFGFLTGQSGAGEQKADTNEIEKQLRETQNSIIEVNNDFEEKRVQQAIDSNRRLQDIARNFGDQRADAFEDGNFLALDKLNTEEARANRDAGIESQRANDDRLRDQQNALRELQNQEQQFHQQRLQLNQQGFQAALNQQQQFMNAFVSNFGNLFGALSGARSGVRRPATP